MLFVKNFENKICQNVLKHILHKEIYSTFRKIDRNRKSQHFSGSGLGEAGRRLLLSLSLSLWEEERLESRKPIRDEIFSLLEEETRSTLLK